MPKMTMTDRWVAAAKSGSDGRTDYFDSHATGLCLRVSEQHKSWNFCFTLQSKRARMLLGSYPAVSLADARGKAIEMRGYLEQGKDPRIVANEIRSQETASVMTVADLVENYLTRRASTKRSADEIARRLRKNVSGKDANGKRIEGASSGCIGNVRLPDLHRRDITKAIDAVKDRGAGVEANRVFEDIRAMIRWARGRGDLDSNLAEGMSQPTETVVRDRDLSKDEIRTMWAALVDADMRESTRRVIRLCLVTSQRVGEVAGMMVDELDLDAAVWTIPPERSKNKKAHTVPLSSMAVEIVNDQLADVKALSERKGRAVPTFVFPGPGASSSVTGAAIAKAIKRQEVIKRGVAKIMRVDPWTAHDLRRTAATGMEELGISPFVVAHVLNHVSLTKATITSRVYARYNYAKEKREALELWADRLRGIVAGSADVISLSDGKKALERNPANS
ncbi:tyrosine-type recombinase/integrase [Mesorhizobium sp. M1273]|uniref:tyrosine-type recombinase/integrase n=1 Tax=Mesorhizobium sp. M1273 TaxID=2957075 RepID=UPI00333C7C61